MRGQTREEARRAWLWSGAIVTALLALAALLWWGSGWSLWDAHPALPAETAQVTQAAAELDETRVDAAFDPEARTLTVTQVMTIRNRWDEALEDCVLRSWSGAFRDAATTPIGEDYFGVCYSAGFDPGGAVVEQVRVGGAEAAFTWLDAAQTALSIPVAAGWLPGETIEVTLSYRVDVPACASRFGESDGLWALSGVFPMLALRQAGEWRLDEYAQVGDPFVAECVNWTVRLVTPEGWQAAASGYAAPVTDGQTQVYTWRVLALRDFGLVLGQGLAQAQGLSGGTLVTAFAKTREKAKEMLKYAVQALDSYGKHYGACDWNALTVAEVDFPYGGMEYPQLICVSRENIEQGGWTLEQTVAHETAHQWWYAAVGSDSVRDAWQDESLCVYSVLTYAADVYGEAAREEQRSAVVESAMRYPLKTDVTPGSPLSYFSSMGEYSLVVYSRGAALWTALESLMGRDALDAALQRYHEQGRFRLVTRAELEALLQEETGRDLTALFSDYLDTQLANY